MVEQPSQKFLSEGYQVIATVSPGKGLGFEIQGSIATYEADLTNEQSVEGAFAAGSIETADGTVLQKMISLNFDTAYFVARRMFIHMVNRSFGRIVFIGSRPALSAVEGKNTIAYALSKSLVFKLSELLNAEASGKNVVTSVIVPGTIDTPANRSSNTTANFSDWVTLDENPLFKMGMSGQN